jgi:hypothetical protein
MPKTNVEKKSTFLWKRVSMTLLEVSLACLHFSLMVSEGEVKSPYFLQVWWALWYKTLYQVLPVGWTNRITTLATRSNTGSHNRLDLIQSLVPTHYVCNGYDHSCRIDCYSETCPNRTLSKPNTFLNQTDFTVPKCLCNVNLCNPNTCLNWTNSSVPKGFGLDRFCCTIDNVYLDLHYWQYSI